MKDAAEIRKVKQLFEANLPFFTALGHPVRQQILLELIERQDISVAQLAATTGLSRPTISHHLKILKDADLLHQRKAGSHTYYCPKQSRYFASASELIEVVKQFERTKLRGGNK